MQCRRGTLGDDSDMTVKRTSPEAGVHSLSRATLSLSFLLSSGSPALPSSLSSLSTDRACSTDNRAQVRLSSGNQVK